MRARNRSIGIFFLLVIFIMLLYIVIPPGFRFLKRIFSEPGPEPEPAFDALAAYPYTNATVVNEETSTGTSGLISRAYAVFNKLKKSATRHTNSGSSQLLNFVIGKRWVDRIMGLDMTASLTAGESKSAADVVAVWQEDYLGYVVHDADNTLRIKSITDFGKQMQKENRNFLFFVTPAKQTQTAAFPDYSEKNRSLLLQGLREQALDFIDVTEIIAEKQLDMKDLFFKTDHHWLPSAGIWADQLLCEFINENYGYCIDTSIFDPENYETTILEDSILGSHGRKVTTAYCEKEDFPVVMPKYDTDLEVFISKENKIYTGSFQDTLFDYNRLEKSISDIYDFDAYNSYGYGDQALVTVHNNNIHDGSRILVIKKSFANVMFPYLSAAVEDLYVVDLRYFNGSLRTLIDETDPETVIIVSGNVNFADNYDLSDVIAN